MAGLHKKNQESLWQLMRERKREAFEVTYNNFPSKFELEVDKIKFKSQSQTELKKKKKKVLIIWVQILKYFLNTNSN